MNLTPQMCKYKTPFLPEGCPEGEGCGEPKTHLPKKRKLVLEFGRNFLPVSYNEGIAVGIFPSGDDEQKDEGDCVTYKLSKSGNIITLTGSDGSYSSVTDASGMTDQDVERVENIATEVSQSLVGGIADNLSSHVNNTTVHVTAEDKVEWSDHLQASVSASETLVLFHDSDIV